jgi:hypothetical protein
LSETARKGGESATLGRSDDLIYTAIIREHVKSAAVELMKHTPMR